MHDASAKVSSGILNGNVNRYGDYNQCLGVVAENEKFRGKYCLAYIQPTIGSQFKYLNYLRSRALSFEAYKSNFDDVSIVTLMTTSKNRLHHVFFSFLLII